MQRLYHDTPGISGYSPHKLVFRRDRHLAPLPYAGTLVKEGEDWFKEMANREKQGGEKSLAIRQQRFDRWNKRHREAPVLGPDKGRVRYRHPPIRSSTLDPGWAGPWEVRSRVGETSYLDGKPGSSGPCIHDEGLIRPRVRGPSGDPVLCRVLEESED